MDPRFLTLEQAAEYLSLPLTMIYRLSAAGELPGKITWGARTIRVDRLVLDAWISEQEGESCRA